MTHIIAVANQKGGVGKTTTVLNIAVFAAMANKRVLVIDNDPQGNASSVLAPDYRGASIYGGAQTHQTRYKGLDIIPSGGDLLDQELRLASQLDGDSELAHLLSTHTDNYDIIFIDCPPSLAVLSMNALIAATGVLIPIQCEYYAMEGLSQILASMDTVQTQHQSPLQLQAIILTMFDRELHLAQQVADEVRKHFKDKVLGAEIPRDVNLAAAPSHNHVIIDHNPLCLGSLAYLSASKEFINGL